MKKVRLNQNYPNDFLTTQNGKIFYRLDNKLDKPENILEVDENNPEIRNLIDNKHLVIVQDESVAVKEEKKPSKKDPDIISGKGLNTKNVLD